MSDPGLSHQLTYKLSKLVLEPVQRLRPLSYSKAHVILIAFAIDVPDSLENVTVKVSFTFLFLLLSHWLLFLLTCSHECHARTPFPSLGGGSSSTGSVIVISRAPWRRGRLSPTRLEARSFLTVFVASRARARLLLLVPLLYQRSSCLALPPGCRCSF